MELRRRRRALPPGVGGAAHPPRAPVRSAAGGPHVGGRAAPAPDHRRLRGDAAASAAPFPAGRRPRRRQDDHGRAADPGADGPRRPGTVSDRLPRQSRRAVAGRAAPPVPASVRYPDQRQARSGPHPQLVPGDRPRHRPPGQAVARRGGAAEAAGPGGGLGPRGVRRGAQAVGHVLRRRGQVHEAVPAGAAPVGPDPSLPADDGDAAQRQGRRFPALPGAARRRPVRGPLP